MKQTIKEKEMLEDLFKKKSSVRYDVPYISSSIVCTKPMLGTIEQDVSGHFGRWNQEEFRAKKLAEIAVSLNNINTVLDIGGGTC